MNNVVKMQIFKNDSGLILPLNLRLRFCEMVAILKIISVLTFTPQFYKASEPYTSKSAG